MSLTGPASLTSLVVESAGGSVDLMADPWDVLSGASGLTGPESEPDSAPVPGLRGARLRDDVPIVGATGHRVFLPLLCRDTTPAAVAVAVQGLRDATSPRHGTLALRGLRSDGTTRRIDAQRHRAAGDEWEPRKLVLPYAAVPLRLWCPDPDWRGLDTSLTWTLTSPDAGTEYPWPPTNWGASSLLGIASAVSGGGDADSWPVWTWTGPADSLTLSHSGGESLTIDRPLAAGDVVTIRTDPRERNRVEHSAEGSWWQHVEAGSTLWRLRPGSQAVTALAVGAADEASVRMAWAPRWEALL